MRQLGNERGIALVTALLLTLVSLAIVMALIYFVTRQTELTAAHKRYRTALEASHGGVEVFTREVIPKLFQGYTSSTLRTEFASINLNIGSSACLGEKLNKSTGAWSAACNAASKSADPTASPDMTFRLLGQGNIGFNVFAKIIDTAPGNSDMSGFELLDSGAGVTGSSSGVAPKHIPALFRIEFRGERETSALERANLSVLYAF